jgi:hypothetical protein
MRQWRSAAGALEQVRRAELRQVDLARVAADLEDACLASLQGDPPGPTSGLVIQQRLFHRTPGR